jgi:type II secretory pathway pseudopilin PulG
MNPKINHKSNGAFTLVEIIGVMAIVGILGAVVAPRVIDGIRESRVTQLAQNLGQWKSGADRYLQKHQQFPVDGITQATTQEGNPYVDPRTGSAVAAGSTAFGDWLLAQGLVSAINVPFGTQTDTRATLPGTAFTTPTTITANALSGFAQIRCSQESGADANTFTATQTRDVPHRVVYLAIPGVPLQEAASIKSKIDGPFTTATGGAAVSDKDLLTAVVAQTGSGVVPQAQREALERGNCRVGTGATAGTYNLYIYITND